MPDPDFIHLRVHSSYSLSEGAITPKALVDLCKKHYMPAVAVTDSSNLFSSLEFSSLAASNGVQPIIGSIMALDVQQQKKHSFEEQTLQNIVLLVIQQISRSEIQHPGLGLIRHP